MPKSYFLCWEFISPLVQMYRIRFAIILFLSAISIALFSLIPLAYKEVLDRAVAGAPFMSLMQSIALAIGGIACSHFIEYIRFRRQTDLAANISVRISRRAVISYLRIPYHVSDNAKKFMLILDECPRMAQFLCNTAPSTATTTITSAVCMSIALYLDYIIVLSASISAMICHLISSWIKVDIPSRSRSDMTHQSERQALASEIANRRNDIISSSVEYAFFKRWSSVARSSADSRSATAEAIQIQTVKIKIMSEAIIYTVLVVGSLRMWSGGATLGTILSIQLLLTRAIMPVQGMGSSVSAFSKFNEAVRIFFDFLHSRTVVEGPGSRPITRITGPIRLQNISRKFGSSSAVSDISITLPKSGFIGLVGVNGSGKSTLLRIIQGLDSEYTGEIFFGDISARAVNSRHIRRLVSTVPQDVTMFSGTIKDNLQWYSLSSSSDAEIDRSLSFSGADKLVGRLPNGTSEKVLEGGRNFSGGERQKLMIARSFLREADILILDEPTSALDPSSALNLEKKLATLRHKKLVILCTHHLYSVVDCDLVLVMHGGSICEVGTHTDLLVRGGEYKRLWDSYRRSEGATPS